MFIFLTKRCCVSGHAVSDLTSSAGGSPGHVCSESAEFPGGGRCHPAAAGAVGAGACGVQPAASGRPAAEHHGGGQPGHPTGEPHSPPPVCVCQGLGVSTDNAICRSCQRKGVFMQNVSSLKNCIETKYACLSTYGQCSI